MTPDSATVVVAGFSTSLNNGEDYYTLAYNAATGAKKWSARYDGPGHARDDALSVSTTPDGSKVLVTGNSSGVTTAEDFATLAYDATTGAKQWTARYAGYGEGRDFGVSTAVTPDGTTLVVAGTAVSALSFYDYVTIAYDVATGAKKWQARYDGPDHGLDQGLSAAMSPDGSKVVVTGLSAGPTSGFDGATIAYDAATGRACGWRGTTARPTVRTLCSRRR